MSDHSSLDEENSSEQPKPDSNNYQKSLKQENAVLLEKINELVEKLRQQEDALAITGEVTKNREEKHLKVVNRLKKQVTQYRDEVIELKAKMEKISEGIQTQLPSVVCQMETKVRKLYKQTEEEQSTHNEEIKWLLEECEEKTQRTVTLAASNTLLKAQLYETQNIISALNVELSTCRQQMEQELLEKEIMFKSSGDNSMCASSVSLMLEETSTLQTEFHSTKEVMINELEALNHDMVAMTNNDLQKHIEQVNTTRSSHDLVTMKEEECKNLTEEIASLQSVISDEKIAHDSTVSGLRDELVNLQTLKIITEKLLERELQNKEVYCENLKLENVELSSKVKTQSAAFETCEAEAATLKEAVMSIIKILTKSAAVDKKKITVQPDANNNGIQIASWAISEVEMWTESWVNQSEQQAFQQANQMEKMVSESQAEESELQQNLSNQRIEYAKHLSDIERQHEHKLLAKEKEFDQSIEQMKCEMTASREKYDSKIANLKHENQTAIRDLEKQHDVLSQNSAKQNILLEKKLLQPDLSKQEMENVVDNKLKNQLQLSENTVDELGKELNSTEKQLFGLQGLLKSDAQCHLDDLQSDLIEATTTATQLERDDLHDAQISIKRQTSIDELYQQEDRLVKEKRNQERDLEENKELKIALQHVQATQDIYAKQSQQSKQFAIITKKNFELMSQIRDMEKMAVHQGLQGEIYVQELESHSQKFELRKAEAGFMKNRREIEEDMLKNSIEEQERKIDLLESKLLYTKVSKARFMKKVKQQDSAITHFHSVLSNSLSGKSRRQKMFQSNGRYGSTGDDDQCYSD